jgi:type VI secretion system secreted protein VgrG
MQNNSYFAGSGSGPTRFEIEIEALDTREAFRPARTSTKPLVHGLQTALVVGPSGTEIYTDQFGRVKVQFHWDRQGKNDENSSCWIRVGQTWAGQNWGAVQIPRVRQEVIVAFLDGDPDRPMIIGSVYNGSNMPPYDLPENATRSGVKSRSSKGGTSDNFNEIRFEDKAGEEQLYIHAEKDHEVVITVTVGGDQSSTITGSALIKAKSITLTTGAASITLNEAGAVEINGVTITIKSDVSTAINSLETAISGGMTIIAGDVTSITSAATVIAGASTDITGEINIDGTGLITGLVVIPPG